MAKSFDNSYTVEFISSTIICKNKINFKTVIFISFRFFSIFELVLYLVIMVMPPVWLSPNQQEYVLRVLRSK